MRTRRGAFSIKLVSVAFLMAFLALLAFDLVRDQSHRELDAEQRIATASQYLANQLNDALREIDLVFDTLSDSPQVGNHLIGQPLTQRDHDWLRHTLGSSIEHIAYLAQIRIVDLHCNTVLGSPTTNGTKLPVSLCAWMRGEGRRSDTFFTATDEGNSAILHATRLYDAQHMVVGMVVAQLSQNTLQPLFANIATGDNGEILILDRHRHLAAFWPTDTARPASTQSADDARQVVLQEDKQQIYHAVSARDRIARLYSERELDNYPLIVSVGQDRRSDRTDFFWQLTCYTLAWLLLAILLRRVTREQLNQLQTRELLLQCSESLHNSELRWRNMLNELPLGIVLVDADSERIHFANPPARIMMELGNPDGSWNDTDPGSPSPRFHIRPIVEWLRQGHLVQEQDVEIERDTQTRLWMRVGMHPMHVDGRMLWMITLADRSEYYDLSRSLADCRQRLDTMERTDMLTRLANRKAMETGLSIEIHRCRRYGLPLSLAYFDIDHFRAFNERYGRLAGDNVLIAVANTLLDSTRSTDICARIAGEEFVVIFTNTSLDYAHQVMERIRTKIASTIFPFAEQNVTFSGGITCWRLGDTADEITKRAEALMNLARQRGCNRLLSDEAVH
ncbi:sensor domain-containing diguanylate cyclase [Paludibacterium purpuratum]|nr:diguanylate cyclase [Paludibacterium purpuratum]